MEVEHVMELKQLSEDFFVAPQIEASDLPALAEAGIQTVICNRPDNESADQPGFDDIEAAAAKLGIATLYLPIVPGMMTDKDVEAFGTGLKERPGPILAYCRTGMRSATLWSFHQAKLRAVPEILSATRNAGYDLDGLARTLSQHANS